MLWHKHDDADIEEPEIPMASGGYHLTPRETLNGVTA
jgi:hypothetical protein